MKEDNNIKPLISAILNLSLKLSKCQNAKTTPKAVTKAKPNAVSKATPKAVTKAKPKAVSKAKPKVVRHNMKGGGNVEFFE